MAAIIVLALVLLLALDVSFWLYRTPSLALAPSSGTLRVLKGSVEVQAPDAITWKEAANSTTLNAGSRVRTLGDSYALLTFAEGSTTKLEPGTELLLGKLDGGSGGEAGSIVLRQRSGRMWNQVTRLPDNSRHFEIQMPSASAVVRGTLFLSEVNQSGGTLIQTVEGQVDVAAQGREVQVPAGRQTVVSPGSPPSAPAPLPPALSELVVTVGGPAALVVIDPNGSATGRLPDGAVLDQISGSQVSLAAESSGTVRIPDPGAGQYRLQLRGAGNGESRFSVVAKKAGDSVFEYAGSCNITTGGEWLLRLQVEAVDGLLQEVRLVTAAQARGKETGAGTAPSGVVEAGRSGQGSAHQVSQWVTIGSVALLSLLLAVIWKRL